MYRLLIHYLKFFRLLLHDHLLLHLLLLFGSVHHLLLSRHINNLLLLLSHHQSLLFVRVLNLTIYHAILLLLFSHHHSWCVRVLNLTRTHHYRLNSILLNKYLLCFSFLTKSGVSYLTANYWHNKKDNTNKWTHWIPNNSGCWGFIGALSVIVCAVSVSTSGVSKWTRILTLGSRSACIAWATIRVLTVIVVAVCAALAHCN